MFTGIVEDVGTLRTLKKQRGAVRLRVAARKVLPGMKVNDSIAINGTCLTVVARDRQSFQVVAVEETLKKTALGSLKEHSKVNLERPLAANARLGGHLVLGHVDCVGVVRRIEERGSSWMFTIGFPHTWDNTIFRYYRVGDRVNIEFDVLGKYIERWVLVSPEGSSLRSVKAYLRRLKRRT